MSSSGFYHNHNRFGSRARYSRRVYIPILLGLTCMVMSLAAAILVKYSRASAEAKAARIPVTIQIEKPLARVQVLVPIKEVTAGSFLTANMFRVASFPQAQVHQNAVHSVGEIEGYFARTLLVPDLPLTREYLTPVKPSSDVVGAIPEGYRAVTIRVDARTGVEGWARAGAMVDVVWSSTLDGKPMISVIVENAKVLSAERQITAQPAEGEEQVRIPTTVTLLAAAADANRIQLATVSGSMSLSLRGLNDTKATRSVPLTIDDLLAQSKPIDLDAPVRPMLSVKGSQGDKVGYTLKDGQLVPLH